MWYKRDISIYYRDKTSGIADVLCLQNENDRDLFQTCAACSVQTWDWSQFTFLLGHLHSYHASTNIHSVIEKYPKSSPTNLCAWQAPPPTRALPLSSSNTANHEHTAHVAGHWLSQNEKSNANWCKRTIQSSVTKKEVNAGGLCIQHGMSSCQFLHDVLGHIFGLRSFVLWLSRNALG